MPIIDLPYSEPIFSEQVAEARRFFLGRTRSPGAVVLGGGFERVQADYVVDRANLPFIGIEFVIGGRGRVSLTGEDFDLVPGMFFIYGERSPHRITTDHDRPLAKYFVDVNSPAGRRLLRSLKLPTDRAWLTRKPADMARLLEELLRHGASTGPQQQAICDSLFHAMMLHASQSVVSVEAGSLAAFETYQRCCRTIDSKAKQLRSLHDLAMDCALDPAYVCRLFKRFDRQTPYQRLLRKRMDLVAARLYGSTVLVKQLAEELGYTDPFHFSRSFKAVFGVSPDRFRSAYARSPGPGKPPRKSPAAHLG